MLLLVSYIISGILSIDTVLSVQHKLGKLWQCRGNMVEIQWRLSNKVSHFVANSVKVSFKTCIYLSVAILSFNLFIKAGKFTWFLFSLHCFMKNLAKRITKFRTLSLLLFPKLGIPKMMSSGLKFICTSKWWLNQIFTACQKIWTPIHFVK